MFTPKYRKKVVYGELRRYHQWIVHEQPGHRECAMEEAHLMSSDYIHMCISLPPKYAISKVVSYIKGKGAIMIARQFGGKVRSFKGERFWAGSTLLSQ